MKEGILEGIIAYGMATALMSIPCISTSKHIKEKKDAIPLLRQAIVKADTNHDRILQKIEAVNLIRGLGIENILSEQWDYSFRADIKTYLGVNFPNKGEVVVYAGKSELEKYLSQ